MKKPILEPEDLFYFNLGKYVEDLACQEVEIPEVTPKTVLNKLHDILFAWSENNADSPIEQRLLAEILFLSDGYNIIEWDNFPGRTPYEAFKTYAWGQHKVGKYRADFMFSVNCNGTSKLIAVECDGHDFHEKTKEQAKHDKARDRYFAKEDILVLRFTGSEIYNDAEKCGEEISNIISLEIEKLMKPPQ